jgi:hypothetical protein
MMLHTYPDWTSGKACTGLAEPPIGLDVNKCESASTPRCKCTLVCRASAAPELRFEKRENDWEGSGDTTTHDTPFNTCLACVGKYSVQNAVRSMLDKLVERV